MPAKTHNIMRHFNLLGLHKVTTEEMFNLQGAKEGDIVYNSDIQTIVVYTQSGWCDLLGNPLYHTIFADNFESGNLSKWTVVNSDTNKWIVGDADSNSGNYSAYISNDNQNPTYTNNRSQVSHIFIEIEIPATASQMYIEFDVKGLGENNYDYMRVYDAPDTYTPQANQLPDNAYRIGDIQYNQLSGWTKKTISIDDAEAGTTRRFICSWRNDSSVGGDSIRIDNFKLTAKNL